MKKNRIKNYLKLVILLFSISLLTTNCEKTEDSLKEESISKPRFSIELVPYETFSKNSKLFEKIIKLDKSTNLNKSRSAYNENYGFTVDLDDSKYLESDNGNYHSYTFTIIRDEPIDLLENLVVSLQPDGSYKTLITAYHLLDFNTFGVAYQEIDFNTDTVFSKTSQSRSCITWTTCEIWDYFCTDCESESPEWTYSCGLYSSHEACDFIDAGDSSTGGGPSSSSSAPFINNGSQWDNTFWSTSSGGGTSNTGNDSNTDNPPYNNEPCIQDANGNCIGDATTPKTKTPEVEVDDCKKLKDDVTDVPLIKTRLNTMKVTSANAEKGLRIDKHPTTGQYIPTPILDNNNGTAHIKIQTNIYTVVIAHTHPPSEDGFFAMFSSPDIIKMGHIIKYAQNPNEVTHILIAEGRTFALRFDDATSVQTLLEIFEDKDKRDEFQRKLKRDYESDNSGFPLYESTTTIAKQQRHLYNLFAKYNLNMSLYEANYNDNGFINDWQKINKDSLLKEPCN